MVANDQVTPTPTTTIEKTTGTQERKNNNKIMAVMIIAINKNNFVSPAILRAMFVRMYGKPE